MNSAARDAYAAQMRTRNLISQRPRPQLVVKGAGHIPPTVIRQVIGGVALDRGVPVAEIIGISQRRRIVRARERAMWLLRQMGYSYQEIGYAFSRHHSTVMAACERCAGKPMPTAEPFDPDAGDESGIWAI